MLRTAAQRRSRRGFTLVELMTVVMIVGVLAVLATLSYRKFITSSRTSEAYYMVGAIRSAEESYRAETLGYLNVSTTLSSISATSWYPKLAAKTKTGWGTSGSSLPDNAAWMTLGAHPDGPVAFGYAVKAGVAGTAMTPLGGLLSSAPTSVTPTEPWYVIAAAADLDANGIYCVVVSSSLTGEVYTENEGE